MISLLVGLPEVSYERILSDESGAGISLTIASNAELEYRFMLSPYYRVYFGKKENASVFFLELNGAVFSYRDWDYWGYNQTDTKLLTGYGLGAGLGGKWVSRSGKWIGELRYGLGRNLASGWNGYMPLYLRGGINLARRF